MSLSTNIVYYYKLDESSGNAADQVASNTLTNTNTVTYSTGKINNGANFNGSSNYLKSGTAYVPGTSDFSYAGWFKTSTSGGSVIFSEANSGSRYFVQTYVDSTGHINSEIGWVSAGNQGVQTTSSSTSYTDGVWHHLVVVHSNPASKANITVYVDGSQILTTTHASLSYNISSLSIGLALGTNLFGGPTQYFNGSLDEVGVWSRALSSAEVTSLYNGGSGVSYPFINNYTRSLSDSLSYGASRTVTLSRLGTFARSASDSIMNAASRLATVMKGQTRSLSDSIMNGASRFVSLSRLIPYSRTISVSIMNSASRFATVSKVRTITRALSDSMMNGASRFVTLSKELFNKFSFKPKVNVSTQVVPSVNISKKITPRIQ